MESKTKQIPVVAPEQFFESWKEKETRYRRLFETARDGIIFLDADTKRIIDANPFLLGMLGYSHEQFIGKQLYEIGFSSTRGSLSAFQELQDKGCIRYEHLPIEASDGRRIDVEFASNSYWVNQSRVIQFNIREISGRKQTAEAKLKIETGFRQARKMLATAIFAGSIAHQFRNALIVITATLDMLEMDVSNNENVAWYIKSIKKSALRLSRLTSQLIAHARREKYSAETIGLNDFVRDTLPLLAPVLKPTIEIEADLADAGLKIRVDFVQMQMILLAIMSNASEAMEEDGCIRIACRNEVITENNAKDFPGLKIGSHVCLTIEDNGRGMDEETRLKVFEPFFTTKSQGRGLGMAAVHRIVNNLGGRVTIESQIGIGTIVRVWLPAFLEIEENAAKESKGKPNRETGIDSQIESDVMVIGEYPFGSRTISATAMERRRGDRRGAPEKIVIL